jgi:carboxyl-terminal processing protease
MSRIKSYLLYTALLLVIFLTNLAPLKAQKVANPEATTKKFENLLYYISNLYVEEVDEKELVEHAIISMLEKLDPHSTYISKEELKKMNEPLQGNFEGIGIRFNILKDTIFVVSPIPGGPSERLGIMAGDKIVEIEGEVVAGVGIKNSDVSDKLRGDKGTRVKVGIQRKGSKDLLNFTITRDKIPIYSVDASYMIEPGIGYIKVNRFAATTMKEFKEAMKKLKDEGMESLILDLQGNGGGYLKTAIEMADEFLNEDKLIVYTEGRAYPRDETRSTRKGDFKTGKLAVLIDQSSASASEIVSGAIQDWDRGVVIGRRSFGKGLVQRPINLPDGSAVRMTISRYYTPAGRCIQKPYEDGVKAYHNEKYERLLKGELTSIDSIQFPDSLQYFTKKNKRLVYGGGGIMPDIFIPLDTNKVSDYFAQLRRKGVFNSFGITYTDKNRKSLKKQYPDIMTFRKNFQVDDDFMNIFYEYALAEGVERDEEGFADGLDYATTLIKASIAQNLWDFAAFYQVINETDDSVNKAIEVLRDDTFEKMGLVDYR